MKTKLIALAAVSVVALSGCATSLSKTTDTTRLSSYSPVEIISQESQKALNAQQVLTKYQQAKNATLEARQASFETDKIVIDYIGKPRSILSSIAIKYGYRFIEVGNVRDLPTVNFTNVYTTPEDLLINLNAKLGTQAKIAINKQEKLITLAY